MMGMPKRVACSYIFLTLATHFGLHNGQLIHNTDACPGDQYECKDGTTCLSIDQLCDMTPNCPGHEDEGAAVCQHSGDGCQVATANVCDIGYGCIYSGGGGASRCIGCDPNCESVDRCGKAEDNLLHAAYSCYSACNAGYELVNEFANDVEISKCVDIDYCRSDPCTAGNTRRCVEELTGYRCVCKTGFGGDVCQMKCHPKCRGTSGCAEYGDGKCDSSCIPGYHLTPKTHICRNNRCRNIIYRLRNRQHCGWTRAKNNNRQRRRRNWRAFNG